MRTTEARFIDASSCVFCPLHIRSVDIEQCLACPRLHDFDLDARRPYLVCRVGDLDLARLPAKEPLAKRR